MLSLGSLLAAGQIGLDPAADAGVHPVDPWMAALLGLLVTAILARLIPERVGRLWVRIERRAHDRNPEQNL